MELFREAVLPILTYNCEIVNQTSNKKIENLLSGKQCFESLYFESPTEKANLHVCRNILGLSKKSSCLAVLGELGQFPVEISCFTHMTKYWHRLKTKMSDDSLVSSFLKLSEADENSGHINWLSTVKFILQYCNLGNIWLNLYTTSTGKLTQKCKKILRDKFIKFFKDKLSNHISSNVKRNINEVETDFDNSGVRGGNKLRTYNLFKQKFSMEPYLLMITNKESRRKLSKLRCGNLDLAIETGRYKKQAVEERLCLNCNKVEDELHFLMECELFTIVREKFFKDLLEIDPNLKSDDKKQMFISLMSTDNCFIVKKVSKVHPCML